MDGVAGVTAMDSSRAAVTVSMVAPVCLGCISGFGPAGYRAALLLLIEHLEQRTRS